MHSPTPSSHKKRRKPCFFKFFFPGVTDKQLEVPKAFLKHLDGDYCGNVLLKGPSGKIWYVSLTEKSSGVFLKSGWQRFVKDHSVRVGYCLVFKYYGNLRFKVKIFDTTACEKIVSHEANIVGNKGNELANTSQDCDGDAVFWHPHPTDRHSIERPLCLKSEELGKKNLEKTLSGTQPSQSTENKVVGKRKRRQGGGSHYRPYISQRRPVTNEEIERAYQAAKSFISTYPTAVVIMQKYHVYYAFFLTLPAPLHYSLPKVSLLMTLYDPSGRKWNTKYIYNQERGRGIISAGWSSFSLTNNIEEHDVCVFELISRDKMQIHIFRVVDEIAAF